MIIVRQHRTWKYTFGMFKRITTMPLMGVCVKIRVVFRLVDKCGNFRNRDIIYTIIDNTPPQLTNPAMDMNVQCNGNGNTAALNAWLASNGGAQPQSDDCQQVTWSNNYAGLSGSCPQTATVTFHGF